MSKGLIKGIHHLTSLSGSARNNARFYTEILGLRFVKKTVNFDSPDTWHLYYGDKEGRPGSVVSFFPYTGITRGKSGNKAIVSIMFSVGPDALPFWMKRLKTHQIEYRGPFTRFNEEYLHFDDFDGIHIELVSNQEDERPGCHTAGIPEEFGIKGIYSVTLSYASAEGTLDFLTKHFDHTLFEENSDRLRLFSGEKRPGNYLDIIIRPSVPDQIPGTGTIHHLSYIVENEQHQDHMRTVLSKAGYQPSVVIDRQYFKSVYFREPGGVLLEIATAGPGFLIDETPQMLGENLMLPKWLEPRRDEIESGLSTL